MFGTQKRYKVECSESKIALAHLVYTCQVSGWLNKCLRFTISAETCVFIKKILTIFLSVVWLISFISHVQISVFALQLTGANITGTNFLSKNTFIGREVPVLPRVSLVCHPSSSSDWEIQFHYHVFLLYTAMVSQSEYQFADHKVFPTCSPNAT